MINALYYGSPWKFLIADLDRTYREHTFLGTAGSESLLNRAKFPVLREFRRWPGSLGIKLPGARRKL
jgi:hypothetical protein